MTSFAHVYITSSVNFKTLILGIDFYLCLVLFVSGTIGDAR
jgi:hypothetical protein